jgi:short subunit dehydrogenase-like uncharacterized protein
MTKIFEPRCSDIHNLHPSNTKASTAHLHLRPADLIMAAATTAARPFSLAVYGATGFTGRLCCEYINEQYSGVDGFTWAIAGRSESKLSAVANELGLPDSVGHIICDVGQQATLDAMAEQCTCILSTVGPYAKYGTPLVEACAKAGTHCTGDPNKFQ